MGKIVFFIALFVAISLKYGSEVRGVFLEKTNSFLTSYLDITQGIENTISEHFAQKDEIIRLREKNQELESKVSLCSAYSSNLNDMLKLNEFDEYKPKVKLVRSVAYANLNDYHKVWIDYKDFNSSKIYGLMYHGKSAGIVVKKDGNPLGLLQGDPKSIFSVFVGAKKIPGIITGNKKEILVKYIPLWRNPKVGDEVLTSGLDGIFFEGVGVGVVSQIRKEELSKTVVIKPYIESSVPSYYHIIEQN